MSMPAKKLTLGYCPIGNGSSIAPFDQIFDHKEDVYSGNLGLVDAVVFWGGTDIHPSLYNQKAHRESQAYGLSSLPSRDSFEWKMMLWCKLNEVPMIGVCRGAQLMCAFAGGHLIQHVNGHHQDHDILTVDGVFMKATSCHHQMMYPYDVEHELLAWSAPSRSTTYEGESTSQVVNMSDKREPEVVYFPTIQGLAIQGHPEWAHPQSAYNLYLLNLIREKLLNQVEA